MTYTNSALTSDDPMATNATPMAYGQQVNQPIDPTKQPCQEAPPAYSQP